ncbi:MAG: hypothetical protein ABEJ99_03105, partial [Candidatus Nanohaloarchaea archaeon]
DVPTTAVDAVVDMLENDRKRVATDGGYLEEDYEADGGYRMMEDVSHQPPEWTNMDNPSL